MESCNPKPTEPTTTTSTKAPEPTTEAPEPETTTTEKSTTLAPEPTTEAEEPTTLAPEPETTTLAPKPSDKFCPEGWKLFGDSCYYFSRKLAKSFNSALKKCQEIDGYLVEVETEEENNFIVAEVP